MTVPSVDPSIILVPDGTVRVLLWNGKEPVAGVRIRMIVDIEQDVVYSGYMGIIQQGWTVEGRILVKLETPSFIAIRQKQQWGYVGNRGDQDLVHYCGVCRKIGDH